MRTRILLCLFFLLSVVIAGMAQETRLMAVSPGLESGIALVGQSSPTFSWSAVPWAKTYRVVVFKRVGTEGLAYEQMEGGAVTVISKDIQGLALSWTPSEAEGLSNGEYVWYVQAVDASGGGAWSEGRMFKVEAGGGLVGIDAKAREKLKEQGLTDKAIDDVLKEANSGTKTGGNVRGLGFSGVVGIQGTEGPSNTYYGQGAGHAAGGSGNSFFGVNAGYTNTTGHSNTFNGNKAGYYNTTGFYNTFNGFEAGYYNTTGDSNTFSGYQAGASNTTGYYNTFSGFMAGVLNNTGSSNTFNGYLSGYSNTTGVRNTFIGAFAGDNNTEGERNAFLGYQSGQHNTTGYYNTFIGANSGITNTTGIRNTFIGSSAGLSNTTGERNAFLGYYSGVNNTIGFANTFFGDATGGNNTTGIRNTYIGYGAGNTNSTGNYNVCIGTYAGFFETGSNRLYIDNVDTTMPLIYGQFDTDKLAFYGQVGVGKIPITHQLEVTGGAYCTGTTWVDASSRALKENILSLDAHQAMEALKGLDPVTFNYKADKEKVRAGFIAEDVPELVATKDRKGMSAMDVVAVLTKVVQEQQKILAEQQKTVEEQKKIISELREEQKKMMAEFREGIEKIKKEK